MRVLTALQCESPLTLAREAVWRARKRWRQMHFKKQVELACPVSYRPLGYYQFHSRQLDEDSRQWILRYAESICRGYFPGFAHSPEPLGLPPQWNLDFVSGRTWPYLPAERLQVVRHDGSDVKVPWELSRLQFLPVLGKAWRLSGEERYRTVGRDLLSHWIKDNPPGCGVNWTIAMEAALRSISICLFLEFLVHPPASQDLWWQTVTASLWQHLVFIEANNEFSYFSRGNHYLSNLVALFCLSSFLEGPGMEGRRRSCQRLLEKEILLQVYPDGGDYEASTGYHLLNLQMFTTAFLLMRRGSQSPSPEFSNRLRAMYRFLAELADQHGYVPHIGDCDDGRVELLADDLQQMFRVSRNDRHSLKVSGLLGIGEALFGENYRGHGNEAVWYGLDAASTAGQPEPVPGRRLAAFPDSGVAIARQGPFEVVFLAQPNGILGKGTHTHNDKLSVLVALDGEPLFVDSGTGCYTRDAQRRNRFRSTAAHNSIQVDGEEQNRFSNSPGAVFMISDDAHVTRIGVQETTDSLALSAGHDGYARFGVTHTRRVTLNCCPFLTLEDFLAGPGHHQFEMRFHLRRQWEVEILQGSGNEVRCRIQGSRVAAELSCQASVELQMSCVSGEISTAYGLVLGGQVIVVRGGFRTTLQLLTHISRKG